MVLVDKPFPRGGTAVTEQSTAETEQKIIFGALQKKIKKVKSKGSNKDNAFLEESAEEQQIETTCAELLSYDTIQEGMNIMGMVKAVDPLYLIISLPGRITARVSALEISDAYTKITKDFLQNPNIENYKPLNELYQLEQLVYGRVMEIKRREHGAGVAEIVMSLKPSEVHAELQHSNIKKGFIFNGAIEEVHEHGYIIETGVKNMRTFVPLKNAQPGHAVGELIYLKVEKITLDKAASICICKEIKKDAMKIKNQIDPNIDYILPTCIVKFNINKKLKDGLQGSIMNDAFTGYVNEHQLHEALALPEDYKLNSTLYARVLYVMPLTKFVYLTLNLRNEPVEQAYKRGDIIDKAKVHHMGTGGVVLILHNKYKGVISYKTLKANYKGNYDQDELLSKYATKSQHKVRVLDYDVMDCMYLCTDHASVVNEKYFALEDLQAGEFVNAIVKQRDEKLGGYQLQVGKLKALIEHIFLAPSSKHLEEHAKLRCRVIAINVERKIIYLTNRAEYMSKSCKVLSTLAAAKPNAIFTGTVVKCEDKYVLVRFFNNLKGMLHRQQVEDFMRHDAQHNFYAGQTMQFRIVSCKQEQIVVALTDDIFRLGEICPASLTHKLDSGLEIQINYGDISEEDAAETEHHMKAIIPVRLLSDFEDLCLAKMQHLQIADNLQAVCIHRNIFSLRDVPFFRANLTKDLRTIQTGDILKAFVKNVHADVIELMVPIRDYGKLVKIHTKMLLVSAYQSANITLTPEQIVFVKVLGKEMATKTITVTALLTQVWDGQLSSTAQFVEDYLMEVQEIKNAFKQQSNAIGKYNIGEKIKAKFVGVDATNGDWQYKIAKTNVIAIIKSSIVNKAAVPAINAETECIILWIDYVANVLLVSNKPGDLQHITKSKQLPTNLAGKTGINAKVLLKLPNIFICSLKKGPNPLVYCPSRLHFNDFEMSSSVGVKEGDFCKLAFIHDSRPIAVLESTWKLWRDIQRKRKTDQQNFEAVKRKKAKLAEEQNIQVAEDAKNKVNKLIAKTIDIKSKAAAKKAVDKVQTADDLFFEDKTPDSKLSKSVGVTAFQQTTKQPATAAKTPQRMPGINNFWNTDINTVMDDNKLAESSDDDEDDDEMNADISKKRKLTAVQKFKLEAEEEKRLRSIEAQYADPKHVPETVDQFDRLVISQPNNSSNWIKYMVFHLQSTEFDKARAVARRALKTINFRNTDELLNIWMAMLNLELNYGNKESFDDIFKEALTYNEPKSVYLRTVEILLGAQKNTELLEIIGIIMRKFKADQMAWRTVADAYFAIGMTERAQQMLQKALQCLPDREHINTIVMFANLNHKYAQNDMAQVLLDQVVTSYPKRVDVWTQYVDMLIKEKLFDSARTVLERAIAQQIPLKKMRTIFKKYLEFEARFGTEDDMQKVKALAQEYVERNAHL